MSKTIAERFWEKVRVCSPDECWEWKAGSHPAGYGWFRVGSKMRLAHRVAWEITRGAIPPEACVLHRCDNRKCVNPNHLFLGTRLDNTADMIAKSRQACGKRNGATKLSKEQVLEIRERYAGGNATQRALACEYGVGQSQIHRIVTHKCWTNGMAKGDMK